MMEFFRSETHKAKKFYMCEACEESICPGQEYTYQVGKFEGDFFTRRWCSDCNEIMNYWFGCFATECEFDYTGVECDFIYEFCNKCPNGQDNQDDCPMNMDIWHCSIIHDQIHDN